jgi:hypothetical protein
LGSARFSPVGFGVAPKQSFLKAAPRKKFANPRQLRPYARRVRYPIICAYAPGRGGGVGRTVGVMFGLGVIDGRGVAVGVAVGVDGW